MSTRWYTGFGVDTGYGGIQEPLPAAALLAAPAPSPPAAAADPAAPELLPPPVVVVVVTVTEVLVVLPPPLPAPAEAPAAPAPAPPSPPVPEADAVLSEEELELWSLVLVTSTETFVSLCSLEVLSASLEEAAEPAPSARHTAATHMQSRQIISIRRDFCFMVRPLPSQSSESSSGSEQCPEYMVLSLSQI